MDSTTQLLNHSTTSRVLLCLGLLVLVVEAVVFCLYARANFDEAGYLYEGWLTVAHGVLPYRDFYAKLPPLLFVLYGLGQHLLGPSMLVGRIESALFLFGGLALAVALARRLAGPWAVVLVVWLAATNGLFLTNSLHAYAVAPTAFLIVVSLALLLASRPGLGQTVGAGAAIGALLLCRHDLLPLALVLWGYMLWWHPVPVFSRLAGVAASLLVFGLIMAPFYLMAPANVLWTLSASRLGPHLPLFSAYWYAVPLTASSLAWHAMMALRYYGGALLLLATALAGLAGSRIISAGLRLMGVAAAVQWVSHIPAAAASGGNIFYLLDSYIFWPVAIAAAALFAMLARAVGDGGGRVLRRALDAVAVCAVLMPIFTGPGPHVELSLRRPTDLERIAAGAAALTRHIPPGASIFTVDDPYQFLEAGLLLPPPLTEQLFNYRDTRDTAVVRQLHLYNDEMITEWLTGGAQYAVISAAAEDWMINSGRYAGGRRLHDFIHGLLRANYDLIAVEPNSWGGPMRIYRLKAQRPCGGVT